MQAGRCEGQGGAHAEGRGRLGTNKSMTLSLSARSTKCVVITRCIACCLNDLLRKQTNARSRRPAAISDGGLVCVHVVLLFVRASFVADGYCACVRHAHAVGRACVLLELRAGRCVRPRERECVCSRTLHPTAQRTCLRSLLGVITHTMARPACYAMIACAWARLFTVHNPRSKPCSVLMC
jgi:hypothetical protein